MEEGTVSKEGKENTILKKIMTMQLYIYVK